MLASDPHGFRQNSSEFNTEAKPESVPSVPGETINQDMKHVSIHTCSGKGDAKTVDKSSNMSYKELIVMHFANQL